MGVLQGSTAQKYLDERFGEAIELKKWDEANREIVVLAKVIEGYAALLER